MTAVNETYICYRRSLMGALIKIVRDPFVAEDLAQEAYVRAKKAADSGTIEHIEAFLQTTARNLALDFLRHRRRRERIEVTASVNLIENVAVNVPSVEDMLIEQRRIQLFDEAIASLPERARQIMILNYLEGWSQPRIAEHLGVSPRTVWGDLKMAMAQCRDVIGKKPL